MKTKNRVCRRWSRRLLFLSVILLGALISSYAQGSLLFKVIELPEQNTTVENVLKAISEKGGFAFTYTDELPLNREVFLEAKSQTVKGFLNELFPNREFKFVDRGNKIIIVPRDIKNFIIPTQTIKGRVLDVDSKLPLNGVNIVFEIAGKTYGTVSDAKGDFRFKKSPVGRANIWFSYMGYSPRVFTNIMIASGKEIVMDVEMVESAYELSEVIISPTSFHKSEPVNDLAMVSTRKISSLEMDNFAGAIADISRAAYSFPGVIINNDGQNHLIIRGNSPKGVLWRLEGVEIPNLNHFAEIGSSGGGIGIISNTMIANSDFFTSAFPAEYGNALSGVFDLNMRKGNTDKHEQTFQLGLLGTEFMAEGPIKKEGGSSYIAQYRYNTLQLATNLFGIEMPSIPRFQDLSFKLHLPSQKMGVFSIFGISGWSHEDGEFTDYIWKSKMSTIGISNTYSISPKTYIKSVAAFSIWKYKYDRYENFNVGTFDQTRYHHDFLVKDQVAKISVILNHKLSANHKFKTGLIIENNSYLTDLRYRVDPVSNPALE